MNLHEYQGKQLFAEYGLPVSKGVAAETPAEAVAATSTIGWLRPRSMPADAAKRAG